MKVRIATQPIEVVAAWPCAHRLVRFFEPPPAAAAARGHAQHLAEQRPSEQRDVAALAPKPMLLDVRLDIDAPILIIPETCDVSSAGRGDGGGGSSGAGGSSDGGAVPILIVNLGSLLFVTVPEATDAGSGGSESSASGAAIPRTPPATPPRSATASPRMTRRRTAGMVGVAAARDPPVFFRTWRATFAETQVLMTRDLAGYRAARQRGGGADGADGADNAARHAATRAHILQPTHVEATVVVASEAWGASRSTTAPRVHVVAHMPLLALQLSTAQWRDVLQIAAAVPELSSWFPAAPERAATEPSALALDTAARSSHTIAPLTRTNQLPRRALFDASFSVGVLEVELIHGGERAAERSGSGAAHTLRVAAQRFAADATWLEGHRGVARGRLSLGSLRALGPKLEPLLVLGAAASDGAPAAAAAAAGADARCGGRNAAARGAAPQSNGLAVAFDTDASPAPGAASRDVRVECGTLAGEFILFYAPLLLRFMRILLTI